MTTDRECDETLVQPLDELERPSSVFIEFLKHIHGDDNE